MKTVSSVQVARFILGFAWIYHGLVPKLLHIAPLESAMTGALGFSEPTSNLITRAAGATEILIGLLILLLYRNRLLIKLNMLALALLCVYVAVMLPHVLMEAFNPVTTNLALIGLSYVLLNHPEPQVERDRDLI